MVRSNRQLRLRIKMDWLEDHLRSFVIPSIHRILSHKEVGPFRGELRPAKGTQFEEAGLLKAYLLSRNVIIRPASGKIKILKSGTDQPSIKESVWNNFERFIPLMGSEGNEELARKMSHRGFSNADIV